MINEGITLSNYSAVSIDDYIINRLFLFSNDDNDIFNLLFFSNLLIASSIILQFVLLQALIFTKFFDCFFSFTVINNVSVHYLID